MFPKIFKNDTKVQILSHQSVNFLSTLTKETVIKRLKKEGIAAFTTPDIVTTYGDPWKDSRITGNITITTGAGCCSFTKNPERWYLFPISRLELAAVGLVEDDLVRWIKYLNDLKIGFGYLYFGEQPASDDTFKTWTGKKPSISSFGVNEDRYSRKENNYFWVCVPRWPIGTNRNVPYLHWIYLRYLINSTRTQNHDLAASTEKLEYYNIPRLIFSLIDDYGLEPFRAFMYCIAMSPWYSGYGLAYSDYPDYPDDRTENLHPDIGVSAAKFKKTWFTCLPLDGSMNNMLSARNNNHPQLLDKNGKSLVFTAKHESYKCFELFKARDIKGLIAYLDRLYYPSKTKNKESGTKKTATKAIRSIARKAKAPTHK